MFAIFTLAVLVFMCHNNLLQSNAAALNNLKLSNMIFDGNSATENQFPWQVMVRSYFPEGEKFCGAAILSTNWIITAGNCIDKAENVTLSLGSNNWTAPKLRMEANRLILHPEYRTGRHNDLGLIELIVPLRFSDSIQPVRLPAEDQIGVTFVGVKGRFSGWGPNANNASQPGDYLKWMDMTVIKNSDCASDYGSIVTDSVICTRGGRICGSDFGGPLIVQEKEGWVVIGVASFNQGCDSEKPTGFSRATFYLNWISNVTGIEIGVM